MQLWMHKLVGNYVNYGYFGFEILGYSGSRLFCMETNMRIVNGHKYFFEVRFVFH